MLALAPLTAASATNHKSKHHSTKTKGSNPNSAICKDVKAEVVSLSTVGTSIEKAMTSGNFAQVKHVMLNTYNVDEGNVQKVLSVIKTAPPNVQAAFKNLLSSVKQIRTDIQEHVEPAWPHRVLRHAGQEPAVGDRRCDHRQLVHVGVRRHPGYDDDGQRSVTSPPARQPCPRHHHS